MAPFYDTIHLEWDGKAYTLEPDFEAIKAIEGSGVSIAALLHHSGQGEPRLSHFAVLLSAVLREAGCEDESASPENLYAELLSGEHVEKLTSACREILFALIPKKELPGNAIAPEDGGEAENTPASPGGNTTKSPSGIGGSSQANSGE
jgi:hypothetical protein